MNERANRRLGAGTWLLLPALLATAHAAEPDVVAPAPAPALPEPKAPSATPAAAPLSSFAGCTAKLSPPLLVFDCPGPLVVATFVAGGPAGHVLQGGMSILEVSSAVVDEVPRPDGEPLKVFIAPTSLGGVVATAVDRRAGTAEFISCSPLGDRCKALVLELVDGGRPDLRPLLSDWVEPEPWPGMKLVVPTGCHPLKADGMSGFACGMDTLQGSVVRGTDEGPEQLLAETVKARATSAEANGTAMKQTPVECQIGGVAGACSFTTRPPHTPFDPPHDVVGYARLPDRTVAVVDCRWGGEATAVPEFCGQMVVFK